MTTATNGTKVIAGFHQTVLTTSDICRLLHVSTRTAGKLGDSGALPCWRLGMQRRWTRETVLAFAHQHGIPLPPEEVRRTQTQVLLCGLPAALWGAVAVPEGGTLGCVETLLELGLALQPAAGRVVVVLDADEFGHSVTAQACRLLRTRLPACGIVVLATLGEPLSWLDEGASVAIGQPVTAAVLVAEIAGLLEAEVRA